MIRVFMDGGKDAKGKSGEDKEREEDEKNEVFEGSGAMIVGDLEELGLVRFRGGEKRLCG